MFSFGTEVLQLAGSCTSPVPYTLECYTLCHSSASESRVVSSDPGQFPTLMPSKTTQIKKHGQCRGSRSDRSRTSNCKTTIGQSLHTTPNPATKLNLHPSFFVRAASALSHQKQP